MLGVWLATVWNRKLDKMGYSISVLVIFFKVEKVTDGRQ